MLSYIIFQKLRSDAPRPRSSPFSIGSAGQNHGIAPITQTLPKQPVGAAIAGRSAAWCMTTLLNEASLAERRSNRGLSRVSEPCILVGSANAPIVEVARPQPAKPGHVRARALPHATDLLQRGVPIARQDGYPA